MSHGYLVRIEMHHANEADYSALHQRMSLLGYNRDIRGDDGRLHRLPTATYHRAFASELSITFVRDQAASAAAAHGWPSAWVLVAHYDKAAWILDTTQLAKAA